MPRKKQSELPGLERTTIKEVDDAAEAYVDARDARMKKTEKEVEAKDALIAVMKKHSLSVYKDETTEPPLIVTITPGKDAVKVTEAQDQEEDVDAEPPRRRVGRSAAAASSDPLEAEADRILAKAGDGQLNDPKLKGAPERHKKARTKTAREVGATNA